MRAKYQNNYGQDQEEEAIAVFTDNHTMYVVVRERFADPTLRILQVVDIKVNRLTDDIYHFNCKPI